MFHPIFVLKRHHEIYLYHTVPVRYSTVNVAIIMWRIAVKRPDNAQRYCSMLELAAYVVRSTQYYAGTRYTHTTGCCKGTVGRQLDTIATHSSATLLIRDTYNAGVRMIRHTHIKDQSIDLCDCAACCTSCSS